MFSRWLRVAAVAALLGALAVAAESRVVQISAGAGHALALLSDGTIRAWGRSAEGQTAVPAGLSGVRSVSAGGYHSLALMNDGTVRAWGRNLEGQTDIPAGLSEVVAIAAGGLHSLALHEDGTVTGWGSRGPSRNSSDSFRGIVNVVSIAAGWDHSLALLATSVVEFWGDGQATGSFSMWIEDVRDVAQGACGNDITLLLLKNGTVLTFGTGKDTWGYPLSGRVPPSLATTRVVQVDVGGGGQLAHSLALLEDGTVRSWGQYCDNLQPLLFGSAPPGGADGSVPIPGVSDAVQVTAGDCFSLALLSDGRVMGWGLNTHGQITIPPELTVPSTPLLQRPSLADLGSPPLPLSTASSTPAAPPPPPSPGAPVGAIIGGVVGALATGGLAAAGYVYYRRRSGKVRSTEDPPERGVSESDRGGPSLDSDDHGVHGDPLSWKDHEDPVTTFPDAAAVAALDADADGTTLDQGDRALVEHPSHRPDELSLPIHGSSVPAITAESGSGSGKVLAADASDVLSGETVAAPTQAFAPPKASAPAIVAGAAAVAESAKSTASLNLTESEQRVEVKHPSAGDLAAQGPSESASAEQDATAVGSPVIPAKPRPQLARSGTAQWIKLEDIEIDRTRPLGRGGFSEVFRGRYRGSPVAVKMLNDMQGDDAAARSFMSEMRIWADLAPCDYVAPLVGYRTDPAFLVTVLYEGGNLSAFLASRNWDRALAVKLLGEAARGLAHLHAGGILHGDVKGENVLVDLASGVPEARVADFGLAKTRTTVLDTVGNRAYQYRGAHGYTLAFAAPEVFEGQDGAKASDVWAFGMTVYQAFAAGKQPYWTVKSIPAITMAIVSGKHPTRLPGMTDDVWDVMVRCWSLDPAARPTMAEVVGMWEREVRS